MKQLMTVAALLTGLVLAVPASRAADEPPAPGAATIPALGSDTFVVVVSDTSFGPDQEDAAVAARYYCANRGKVPNFVGKDRPLEFRSQVLQQWSLLTYRCVVPGQAAN